MEKLVIYGGEQLRGRVSISGAKNAVLALMPAAILAPGVHRLRNVPRLRDVWTMMELLDALGCTCRLEGNELVLDTSTLQTVHAPQELVRRMRASFYVLGPLLARYRRAEVPLPGGCAWGPRPVDLHLKGLQALGAELEFCDGYVRAIAEELHGTEIVLDFPSVGATGNLLMAASLARGRTVIRNAAREPEIVQLGEFLCQMGARIQGLGTPVVEVEGVEELHPASVEVIPDRIEAATFLLAAAMTGGEVTVEPARPEHLKAILQQLERVGARLHVEPNRIGLSMEGAPLPSHIVTAPFPGFPTDVQAQWTALMLRAPGISSVTDAIYPDRFKHVPELQRLGAQIELQGNTAVIAGGRPLRGNRVVSSDLRASAALILAGLVAEGCTEVLEIHHIDRGYEAIERKLQQLGAKIERVGVQD